jgi:hypothetical protein
VDVAILRLCTEEAEKAAHQGGDRVGVEGSQAALHALGTAGGAGGVVHHLPGGAILGQRPGLALAELAEGAETGQRAEGEARPGGEAQLLDGAPAGLGEALRAEEGLGLAVPDDVGDLGGRQVVVDGGQVPAGLGHGEVELDRLGAVGQDGGHAIALLETQRAQAVHDAVALREQLAAAPLAAVGGDEPQDLGILLGEVPETEQRHRDSFRAARPRRPRPGPSPKVEHVSLGAATERAEGRGRRFPPAPAPKLRERNPMLADQSTRARDRRPPLVRHGCAAPFSADSEA